MNSAMQIAHAGQTYQACLLGVVVWDWLVSLRAEYTYIWKGSNTGPTILYVICRYVCLILTVCVFTLNFLNLPLEKCNTLVRVNCMALTVIQTTSILVLTHRVYAVLIMQTRYRNYLIGLLLSLALSVLVLGCIHAGVGVHAYAYPMTDNGRGFCQVLVIDQWKTLTVFFFALPIVAHTIATVAVAYAVASLPNTNAVKRVLLVDGGLYLLAVTTIGLIQIIFFFHGSSMDPLPMLNSAALLALTSVFCCRFMLHLRQKAQEINRSPFGTGATPQHSGVPSSTGYSDSFEKPKLFFTRSASSKLAALRSPPPSAGLTTRSFNATANNDSGVVTVSYDPEICLEELDYKPSLTPASPTHGFKVKVECAVRQEVESMTSEEKDYSKMTEKEGY